MMKMHDMAESRGMPQETTKDKKYYPSFTVVSSTIPELNGKSIGSTVDMHIKGEIKSCIKTEENTEYRIEMKEMGLMGGPTTMEDEIKTNRKNQYNKKHGKEVIK